MSSSAKKKGATIEAPVEDEELGDVINLMEALKHSLKKNVGAKSRARKTPTKAHRKTSARRQRA